MSAKKKTAIHVHGPDSCEPLEKQILEVAERQFLAKGFAATSTTDIAKEVGCNQALVHYYFRTKENLFQQIFEEQIKYFVSEFFRIDGNQSSFIEGLERKVGAHFDMIRANPRLPLLIINDVISKPERLNIIKNTVKEHGGPMMAKLEEDLSREYGNGTIRKIAVMDLIMNIITLNAGTMVGMNAMELALGLDRQTIDQMLDRRRDEIVNMIIGSLKIK